MKYGDNNRFPLKYLETCSTQSADYYEFPSEMISESFESYKAFPKLSQEILVAFFASVGVRFVPEITLYELKSKTPFQSFEDFCVTFGAEDNEINTILLNKIIERLRRMDRLREKNIFDSRPIYTALLNRNLEQADRLIEEMKDEYNMYVSLNNLNKDR